MNNMSHFERAKIVWQMEARSIDKLVSGIDPIAFNAVIEAIHECMRSNGRLFITGKGTSGAAGKKVAHTLCCVDIPASFISIGEGVNASMGLLKKGDILFMFSKGGSTKEVIDLIKPCVNKGVKIIAVTSNPASQLALKCNILLRVSVEREVDEKNALATASTIAMISAFDAIAVSIQEIG